MDLERVYRDIVESSPDPIWLIDFDARTLYANPAMADLYGVPTEEMSGVTFYDTVDEEGAHQFADHLSEVMAGGPTFEDAVETLFHPRDGEPVWMLLREGLFRDKTSGVQGLLVRFTPYQERRDITQALAESRTQLADAQRIARMGGWTTDGSSRLIVASEELIETFALDPDFFPTDLASFASLVHPDDREGLIGHSRAVLRGGAPYEFTMRIGDEDRGWTWAKVRGVGRRGPDGKIFRVEGTLQNVTESMETELALRDQVAQNRLMNAVATAANEASTLDELLAQAKHLVLLHDDWRRARGFRHHDGHLEPIYLDETDRLVDVEDPTLLESDLALARQVLEPHDVVWDEAGLTVAFPVFVRDELLAVLAIESAPPLYRHEMIESFVRQVSAQMNQVALREQIARQMQEARDAAMVASQQKSDFLAMVSHEIRTPLNGVIGLNELLLQTELDDEQRKLATGAGLSGRMLLSLINDILDFSKIEAGQLTLERLNFAVRETLDQLVATQRESADQKGVRLEVQYGHELPDVLRGDPTRLAQVVNNLVSNAVKFTDDGSVVVDVQASRQDSGDDAWVLRCEVTDTGIGIDSAVEGLFEPFRQADTSTSRRFGGTGLGLAISRELVTLAGGDIGYDSTPGEGSRFWFTMRMGKPTGGAVIGRRVESALRARGPSRRVLLVEDNPVNRMVAAGMLKALGHEVETAEDGLVALELLEAHQYDAALLDIQMPRLDGYGTARAIRTAARESTRSLPLIALTAAAVDGERQRCLDAGMDDFVTKPIDPHTLAVTLGRWLHDSPRLPRPHEEPQPPAPVAPDNEDLDLGRLQMLRELIPGSTAYLDRAIDNFLSNSPGTEARLREALAAGDAETLGFLAHSLKGSAGNIGLTRVADAAEVLQHLGDTGELEGGAAALARLSELLRTGRAALRGHRQAVETELSA